MREITKRQIAVLANIHAHVACFGYPPSIREMQEAHGIRTIRGITGHVDALERKGYLVRKPFTARGIRITAAGHTVLASQAPSAAPSFCLEIAELEDETSIVEVVTKPQPPRSPGCTRSSKRLQQERR